MIFITSYRGAWLAVAVLVLATICGAVAFSYQRDMVRMHLVRDFQRAPRPNICRTTRRPHGSLLGLFGNRDKSCKEAECGYTDTCCDDSCCDTCGTGCGYADADCGCDDGCCGTCDGGCCVNGCSDCGGRGCGLCQRFAGQVCPHGGGYPESYNFAPSPPGGQVAYPYYTVRGPRDFLRDNPPSIGPY